MRHLVGLKKQLLNGHGKPYENEESKYGWMLIDVLVSISNCTGMDKIKAYKLSLAIKDAEEFDIEEADAELCIRALEEAKVPAIIHAQLFTMLEGVKKEQVNKQTDPVAPEQIKVEPTQIPAEPVKV